MHHTHAMEVECDHERDEECSSLNHDHDMAPAPDAEKISTDESTFGDGGGAEKFGQKLSPSDAHTTRAMLTRPPPSALPAAYLRHLKLSPQHVAAGPDSPNSPPQDTYLPIPPSVTVTGSVLKKVPNMNSWRRRFLVLRTDTAQLVWYKQRAGFISGESQSARCSTTLTPDSRLWQSPRNTQFTLQNGHKEWTFDAGSAEELSKWQEALCSVFRRLLDGGLGQGVCC